MSKDPSMLFRLDGRIALVTGASSGLGVHFAGVLARRRHRGPGRAAELTRHATPA